MKQVDNVLDAPDAPPARPTTMIGAVDYINTLPLIAGLVLAGVHLSTITLQVPAHGRLEHGWDPIVADRLVRTNWIRTIGWTIRGVLALFMIEAVA